MHTATLDTWSAAVPQTTVKPQYRVVAATIIGNALEFYDFVTYAFFAVYIGKAFFPASDPLTSLLVSVGVFGVGFISRPLGGILIGAYADRVGRKPALLLTIVLITVGTLGVALTPPLASIGIAAPIIVIVARLIQGLGLGGEVGPSAAFLIEIAPPGKRATYGAWLLASQGLAFVVAGGIGVLMTLALSAQELHAWGWRVPFAFGLLLIPVALYLRKNMPETLDHHAAAATAHPRPSLLRGGYGRQIVFGVLAVMGGTIATYLSTYMTTYAIATLKLPPATAMVATVVVGAVTLVFALLGGMLADRVGRKPVMIWPRLLMTLTVVPAFWWLIDHKSAFALYAVSVLVSATTAVSGAATLVAIPELFSGRVRALGMSVIYAVGVAIFGGSTQFIMTWLLKVTGSPAAPAWYAAGAGILCLLGMALMPETRSKQLEH